MNPFHEGLLGPHLPVLCRPAVVAAPAAPHRLDGVGRKRPARGFTLIEIMVVVTILGILAALIVPRVIGRTDDARVAAAKQDVAQLMQALKLYRLDNGRYPSNEQGLQALVERPTLEPVPGNWKQGGYLDSPTLHKDPGATRTSI